MSGGGRGRATLAVLLAVAGGLATAGGTAAAWVRIAEERDIGGVPVPEIEMIGGMALAPALLPLGLCAAVAGLALLVARGRLQQAFAVLLVLAGLGAGALVFAGVRAAPVGGALGAGVVFSGLGALLLAAAGVLALRPAPPARLPPRYDLDAEDADEEEDEWRLASDESDDDPSP